MRAGMVTTLRRTTTVVAWAFVVCVVAVLTAAVFVPRLGGATPYAILTSSMEPTMPPGTLAVVKPVEPEDIAAGDVITFQLESGESTVATHRVVAVTSDGAGGLAFLTQGDGNDVADEDEVIPAQLKGRLWYQVPHAGRLHVALDGAQRSAMVTGVAVALIAYASYQFTGAARSRRHARRDDPATATAAVPQREEVTV